MESTKKIIEDRQSDYSPFSPLVLVDENDNIVSSPVSDLLYCAESVVSSADSLQCSESMFTSASEEDGLEQKPQTDQETGEELNSDAITLHDDESKDFSMTQPDVESYSNFAPWEHWKYPSVTFTSDMNAESPGLSSSDFLPSDSQSYMRSQQVGILHGLDDSRLASTAPICSAEKIPKFKFVYEAKKKTVPSGSSFTHGYDKFGNFQFEKGSLAFYSSKSSVSVPLNSDCRYDNEGAIHIGNVKHDSLSDYQFGYSLNTSNEVGVQHGVPGSPSVLGNKSNRVEVPNHLQTLPTQYSRDSSTGTSNMNRKCFVPNAQNPILSNLLKRPVSGTVSQSDSLSCNVAIPPEGCSKNDISSKMHVDEKGAKVGYLTYNSYPVQNVPVKNLPFKSVTEFLAGWPTVTPYTGSLSHCNTKSHSQPTSNTSVCTSSVSCLPVQSLVPKLTPDKREKLQIKTDQDLLSDTVKETESCTGLSCLKALSDELFQQDLNDRQTDDNGNNLDSQMPKFKSSNTMKKESANVDIDINDIKPSNTDVTCEFDVDEISSDAKWKTAETDLSFGTDVLDGSYFTACCKAAISVLDEGPELLLQKTAEDFLCQTADDALFKTANSAFCGTADEDLCVTADENVSGTADDSLCGTADERCCKTVNLVSGKALPTATCDLNGVLDGIKIEEKDEIQCDTQPAKTEPLLQTASDWLPNLAKPIFVAARVKTEPSCQPCDATPNIAENSYANSLECGARINDASYNHSCRLSVLTSNGEKDLRVKSDKRQAGMCSEDINGPVLGNHERRNHDCSPSSYGTVLGRGEVTESLHRNVKDHWHQDEMTERKSMSSPGKDSIVSETSLRTDRRKTILEDLDSDEVMSGSYTESRSMTTRKHIGQYDDISSDSEPEIKDNDSPLGSDMNLNAVSVQSGSKSPNGPPTTMSHLEDFVNNFSAELNSGAESPSGQKVCDDSILPWYRRNWSVQLGEMGFHYSGSASSETLLVPHARTAHAESISGNTLEFDRSQFRDFGYPTTSQRLPATVDTGPYMKYRTTTVQPKSTPADNISTDGPFNFENLASSSIVLSDKLDPPVNPIRSAIQSDPVRPPIPIGYPMFTPQSMWPTAPIRPIPLPLGYPIYNPYMTYQGNLNTHPINWPWYGFQRMNYTCSTEVQPLDLSLPKYPQGVHNDGSLGHTPLDLSLGRDPPQHIPSTSFLVNGETSDEHNNMNRPTGETHDILHMERDKADVFGTPSSCNEKNSVQPQSFRNEHENMIDCDSNFFSLEVMHPKKRKYLESVSKGTAQIEETQEARLRLDSGIESSPNSTFQMQTDSAAAGIKMHPKKRKYTPEKQSMGPVMIKSEEENSIGSKVSPNRILGGIVCGTNVFDADNPELVSTCKNLSFEERTANGEEELSTHNLNVGRPVSTRDIKEMTQQLYPSSNDRSKARYPNDKIKVSGMVGFDVNSEVSKWLVEGGTCQNNLGCSIVDLQLPNSHHSGLSNFVMSSQSTANMEKIEVSTGTSSSMQVGNKGRYPSWCSGVVTSGLSPLAPYGGARNRSAIDGLKGKQGNVAPAHVLDSLLPLLTCDVCSQNTKGYFLMALHMMKVHNVHFSPKSLAGLCDVCGNQYPGKGVLENHIIAVHSGFQGIPGGAQNVGENRSQHMEEKSEQESAGRTSLHGKECDKILDTEVEDLKNCAMKEDGKVLPVAVKLEKNREDYAYSLRREIGDRLDVTVSFSEKKQKWKMEQNATDECHSSPDTQKKCEELYQVDGIDAKREIEVGCMEVCKKKTHKKMRKPKEEGPYFCDWQGCNQILKTRATLKVHVRRHTGEKPFACHVCEYRGRQIASLHWHLFHDHGIGDKYQSSSRPSSRCSNRSSVNYSDTSNTSYSSKKTKGRRTGSRASSGSISEKAKRCRPSSRSSIGSSVNYSDTVNSHRPSRCASTGSSNTGYSSKKTKGRRTGSRASSGSSNASYSSMKTKGQRPSNSCVNTRSCNNSCFSEEFECRDTSGDRLTVAGASEKDRNNNVTDAESNLNSSSTTKVKKSRKFRRVELDPRFPLTMKIIETNEVMKFRIPSEQLADDTNDDDIS